MTSESRRCYNVNIRSKNQRWKHNVATTSGFGCCNDVGNITIWQRCEHVVTTLSDVATKIQSKLNAVNTTLPTSCVSWVRGCLHEMRPPTGVGYLTWVESQQWWISFYKNNSFIWEWFHLMQLRSDWSGMIFLHVNSFSWASASRQDCYLV